LLADCCTIVCSGRDESSLTGGISRAGWWTHNLACRLLYNCLFRKGRVQFDGWHFTSRLVDLPTVIESQKTIDSKTFYKTADICQILICKVPYLTPRSSTYFRSGFEFNQVRGSGIGIRIRIPEGKNYPQI
jgi:hypothetical protein